MPNRVAQGGKNNGGIEQQHPLSVSLAVAAGTVSGDIYRNNDLVGYVQTDRDDDGNATIYIPGDFAEVILVYGRGNGINTAIAVGDLLYFDAGDSQINVDAANGVEFGYALAAVGSGESDDILVAFGM